MTVWLNGWTGDNAGDVIGRKPNSLLIAETVTYENGVGNDGVWDPYATEDTVGGHHFFPHWRVECLTEGSRDAWITTVSKGANIWNLQLCEVDLGDGRDPWDPGVHLFSIKAWANSLSISTTLATADIHSSIMKISLTEPGMQGPLLRKQFMPLPFVSERQQWLQDHPPP